MSFADRPRPPARIAAPPARRNTPVAATLVMLGLLLSACSCNGQKHADEPNAPCDPDAILTGFDNVYSAIDRSFDAAPAPDCETIGVIANEWLDQYQDKLQQVHAESYRCRVRMGPDAWTQSSRVMVALSPPGCPADSAAGKAYARYNELTGSTHVQVYP